MPETLSAELAAAARRRGISKSALVREAIQSFLLADEAAGGREPGLTRIADLVGAFTGPADLSVNDKYLEGFGE
ncbi:MAG: ribbon-helix-helix protein, CopG family [Gammaproteobacteria bacterium]|nr:ribbon-helix-helix protein, CopG family [Gammaproteobacteria bacterium]